MSRLDMKVAVVTGASRGIGAGIAKTLGAQGASVIVNYSSNKKSAESVVAEITKAGGRATAVGGSIANPNQIEELFGSAQKMYGKVDILVNNAGLYSFTPIETLTTEIIMSMFNVNVVGLLLATTAALPCFPAEGSSIINVGSVVGENPPAMASVYAGTKGAVNSITRALAKELGPKNIRINAVNPGPIPTEGFSAAGLKEFEGQMIKSTPLGRLGSPDDIAEVVAFLASDESRWITGSLIDAGGGFR